MMHRSLIILLFVLTAAIIAVMTTQQGCSCQHPGATTVVEDTVNNIPIDTALRARLETFAASPRPQGQFALHVFDLTANKPVYGFQETLALPSASCLKLLTGIAGLKLLGTDYTYRTEILAKGKVAADGTWKGNIAFRAGLHPQLMEADMVPLAAALRKMGVKKIGGKLIVDLAVTEPVQAETHWYPWDLTFAKYGLLYKGAPRVVQTLKVVLRGQGIAVADSQIVKRSVPAGFRPVSTASLPVDEVIKRMWKNSSNTQSTSLLYTIGSKLGAREQHAAKGVDYLRHFLRDSLALADTALVIHDGCGLCTHNRLSPEALTTILRYGYQDKKIRPFLERNLSVAGVDGTLAREMSHSKTRGKVWAKTGTLSHPYGISSLAGFCKSSNGHTLAFAIMDSEMSVLDARVLQNKLCRLLVE